MLKHITNHTRSAAAEFPEWGVHAVPGEPACPPATPARRDGRRPQAEPHRGGEALRQRALPAGSAQLS